jgi:outer membrane protein assembly factor BamB
MGSISWRLRAGLTLALVAATSFADSPLGPEFSEQWRFVPGIELPGAGGVATADVDADGSPDFVLTGRNYYSGSSALLVIGANGEGAAVKQALILPDQAPTTVVRVLAATIDGAVHVYSIVADGNVRDFGGWPLAEQHEYSVPSGVTAAAIGDALGDGQVELIVATNDALQAFDAATGMLLWSYPVTGVADIVLAQLDADPALEIVASSGLVIDAATLATDWQYPDIFGQPLAAGHLLGDATTQFVAAYTNYFIVFRGTPWSPLWSAGSNYYVDRLITANLDNDDGDVIVTAASHSGYIDAWDPMTHQVRFSAPGFGWSVSALGAARIFPDSPSQLLVAGRQGIGNDSLRLLDTGTGTIPWAYTPWKGIFSPVEIADVDGDGNDELVVAASEPFGNPGTVGIFDADTGVLKWQGPTFAGNYNAPFALSTARILLVPHAANDAMDIVLAGTSGSDGRITVVDGSTHAVRLQIGSYASGPLASREIVDAALVDFDGNGVLDYAVATQATSTAASGALLQVFSGLDGQPLWSSDPIGSGFFNIDNVLVTGTLSDPASELIAVMPGYLQAFDLQTHSPGWTLFVPSDATAYVPHGIAGAEIMTFLNTGAVTFYDAVTHAELRSFTLEAPLAALVAPGGDSHKLVAVSNNALVLIDGVGGAKLAASANLGALLGLHNQLAVAAGSTGPWQVASGSDLGIFKHSLALGEVIFVSGFEAASPL